MRFFLNSLVVVFFFLIFMRENFALGQDLKALRYISAMIKDRQASVQEAKDFYQGKVSLKDLIARWKLDPGFRQRIKRLFNDWFGIGVELNLLDFSHYLSKHAEGYYYHEVKGLCDASEIVSVNAWWLTDRAAKVSLCPNIVSELIYRESDDVDCNGNSANGILHADCGCGPDQLLCLPMEFRLDQEKSVREEFANRAYYGYRENLSWIDVLGSDHFIGDKYLYHFYLMSGWTMINGQLPTEAELDTLDQLNYQDLVRIPFPSSNPERAGIVTAPGFMQQYNNFRSRIRALSEQLLCKDIDSSLNTHDISTFVNEDLSDFDRSHGTQEACSGCHYPMDNMGSTLLGWNSIGFYEEWLQLDQAGYVFGESGSGPLFLMKTFVEQGPGFHECVSKKVWEDFTGYLFVDIAPEWQDQIIQAAQLGPRALIEAVLNEEKISSLAKISSPNETKTSSNLDFSQDIDPILTSTCAGSQCHSFGTILGSRYEFVGNGDNFKKAPSSRLTDGSMPPTSSDQSLSSEDRMKLLDFLSQ